MTYKNFIEFFFHEKLGVQFYAEGFLFSINICWDTMYNVQFKYIISQLNFMDISFLKYLFF